MVIGVFLVIRVGSPIVRRLERQARALEKEVEERKEVERLLGRSERKYRSLFEHASDSIFIIDASTRRFLDVNENAAWRLGYDREELLGMTIDDIDMPTAAARNETVIRELLHRGSIVFEHAHRRKDGTPMDVEISARVIEVDGRKTFQSLVRDITERKRIEAVMRGANIRMKRDLETAARVQKSLLPKDGTVIKGLSFAHSVRPCEELGGDVLNFFQLDDAYVGLYVLDVSGHGVSAALQSVMLNRVMCPLSKQSSLLREHILGTSDYRIVPPAEVAARLNQQYPMDLEREHYFTLIYGILNRKSGEFRYVSAGHPGPIHVPCLSEPAVCDSPGFPIGVYKDADYYEHSITLRPGDRLYLYSDGVMEAPNVTQGHFGQNRLVDTLRRARSMPLQSSISFVLREVSEWCLDEKLQDDVSLLAVEMEDEEH